MLGERCTAVRLDLRQGRPVLTAAEEGEPADVGRWRPWLRGSRLVLVLGSDQRFLQTLDRPEVPEADLPLALRWPMAEALSAEAEQLLTAAVSLPRLNEATRQQVLGVAARLETVQAPLAALAGAGLDVRRIDIIDTALRGMALLQQPLPPSAVAVCLVGQTACIGLIRNGQIAGLRSVPLPPREGYADIDLAEQLALNTRRTFDHYERQALLGPRTEAGDPLAVGGVLASVASLSQAGQEIFTSALPQPPKALDLTPLVPDAALRERCTGHDLFTALAFVALARMHDHGMVEPADGQTADAQPAWAAGGAA